MVVSGFARDIDGLFRIILTQHYVPCERLAKKEEILDYIASKGLHRNEDDFKESFTDGRIILEDMHPIREFTVY